MLFFSTYDCCQEYKFNCHVCHSTSQVVLFLFFTARTSQNVFLFLPHLWPEPEIIVGRTHPGPLNPGWIAKTFFGVPALIGEAVV